MARRWLPGICSLFGVSAQAASLALPGQVATPGQVIVAPLSWASQGQSISGVQFDMASDSALSVRILPGGQLGGSAKNLYTAALPGGGLRVLIVGMNATGIADGDLLRAIVAVDPAAAPGVAQIRFTNAIATDPGGNAVPVSMAAAAVQVQAGSVPIPFTDSAVVNAASLLPGAVSPGEILTIFGRPDLAAASSVLCNGARAPILYAGQGQVNAIVPFGLDAGGSTTLEIRSAQGSLGSTVLPTKPVAPALFATGAGGNGPGAILNPDYTPNSFAHPATAGSIVMLYGTGFGPLVPAAIDGQAAAGPAATAMPVTAFIGGLPAEVIYAGAAPGLIAGVVQINVRIPSGIGPNPVAPVSLAVGGVNIPPGVTIAVQ